MQLYLCGRVFAWICSKGNKPIIAGVCGFACFVIRQNKYISEYKKGVPVLPLQNAPYCAGIFRGVCLHVWAASRSWALLGVNFGMIKQGAYIALNSAPYFCQDLPGLFSCPVFLQASRLYIQNAKKGRRPLLPLQAAARICPAIFGGCFSGF